MRTVLLSLVSSCGLVRQCTVAVLRGSRGTRRSGDEVHAGSGSSYSQNSMQGKDGRIVPGHAELGDGRFPLREKGSSADTDASGPTLGRLGVSAL